MIAHEQQNRQQQHQKVTIKKKLKRVRERLGGREKQRNDCTTSNVTRYKTKLNFMLQNQNRKLSKEVIN